MVWEHALLAAALLGLASYILHAKLARDAAHSEKDHDRHLEDRDKKQRQATLQLERVRSQNVYDFTAASASQQRYRRGGPPGAPWPRDCIGFPPSPYWICMGSNGSYLSLAPLAERELST